MRFTNMPIAASVLAVVATGATAAVPAASASGTPPAAPRACTPTAHRLPDLGYGGEVLGFVGHDVVGAVMGRPGPAGSHDRPAVWRNGQLHLIGGFRVGVSSDINDSRMIVGSANRQRIAWVRIPHEGMFYLKNVDGSSGPFSIYARRINESGQIAGAVDFEQYAARWDDKKAEPTVLQPAAGDTYSFAKGINDAGWVAGDTDAANFVPRAAVWDPSDDIHVFDGGFGPGSPATLYEINNARQSAGESFELDADGNIVADVATRWSADGTPTTVGYLPHDNLSTAFGLSPSGYLAGVSMGYDYSTGQQTRPSHAFVWDGSGPVQTLPVPGLPYRRSESLAHQITDQGRVAGRAGPVGGPYSPYVWTCVFGEAFRPTAGQAARETRPLGPSLVPSRLAPGGGFEPAAPTWRTQGGTR